MRRFTPVVLSILLSASVVAAQTADAPLTDPETARGNEPFWNAEVAGDVLTIWRLDRETVSLPVVVRNDATAGGTDLSVLIAEDAAAGRRASLLLTGALCHDSMSGLPYPATAELTFEGEVLHGCGGDPRDLLTASEWDVVSLSETPVLAETEVVLRFATDGAVSGSGGCNRLMTQYGMTGEGLSILPQIATTMMACPDPIMAQEARVQEALAQVTRFDIGTGGGLILIGPDDTALIRAQPASDG